MSEDTVEKKLVSKMQESVDRYLAKYPKEMAQFEKSTVAKLTGGINGRYGDYHVNTLGEQLEKFDETLELYEEANSLSSLGALPSMAHGIITINYSENPVSAIAIVQNIDEEDGGIWYRDRVAETVKGNIGSADTTILSHGATQNTLQNYTSDSKTSVTLGTGTGSQTVFAGTLAVIPLRRQSLVITVSDDADVYGRDVDGDGIIQGTGLYGTIDYTTGVYSVTVASAITALATLNGAYSIDFEAATSIPSIALKMVKKPVKAQVFACNTKVGIIERSVASKRFKFDATKIMAEAVIEEIIAEITGKLILDLYSNAVGSTTWDYVPDTGVSDWMHLKGISRTIQQANSVIVGNAHMGEGNVIIAGYGAADVLKSTGGEYFKPIAFGGGYVGPHIFGTYEGRIIIRVPDVNILAKDEMLLLWKGDKPFHGGAYNAVYIPLLTTGTLPTPNPLLHQQAAATMQAVGTLNPNFITKIVISNFP